MRSETRLIGTRAKSPTGVTVQSRRHDFIYPPAIVRNCTAIYRGRRGVHARALARSAKVPGLAAKPDHVTASLVSCRPRAVIPPACAT